MQKQYFIIVDQDDARRNAVVRALWSYGYAVPVNSIEELAQHWPSDGWIIVHDHDFACQDLLAKLKESGRYFPVIAYAETLDAKRIVSCIQAGAEDYLHWPVEPQALQGMLYDIATKVDAKSDRLVAAREASVAVKNLSPREYQVLSELSEGKSNRQIAETLGISPRTVEIHRANMLGKLGAENSASAARTWSLAQEGGTDRPEHASSVVQAATLKDRRS